MATVPGYSVRTSVAKTGSAAIFLVVIGWAVNAYHTGDWSMDESTQTAFTIIGTAVIAAVYTLVKNVLREKFGVDLPSWIH